MTDRYDIDEATVRFEYLTAAGDPPKSIKLDGVHWQRQGYHPLSYDASRGLVWYKRYVTPTNR
jgi:hypothetical protein